MQTARVDLSKIDSTYIFNVMQEDTDRQIRIELFDDGELYEVSGDTVSVWYEGSSGDAGNFSEGIVKEANALIITLDEHMTKNPGKYTLAVMLTRVGGNISTWNMVVNVSPLPGRSRSAAEEYFGAFSLTSLASDLNALNTRVDNIIANAGDTGNNAELVDIRLGYDGTTYPTAGDAVRKQVSSIHTTLDILNNVASDVAVNIELDSLYEYNNGYLTEGNVYENKDYYVSITCRIFVDPKKTYLYKGVGRSHAVSAIFYDDAEKISTWKMDTPNEYVEVPMPKNTVMVIFSSFAISRDFDDVPFSVCVKDSINERVNSINERVNSINERVNSINERVDLSSIKCVNLHFNEKNKFNPDYWENGYVNAPGDSGIIDSDIYRTTGFYPVSIFKTGISISGRLRKIAFYDKSLVLIRHISLDIPGPEGQASRSFSLSALQESGAKYFRFSYYKSAQDEMQIEDSSDSTEYVTPIDSSSSYAISTIVSKAVEKVFGNQFSNILYNKKWAVCGDSFSAGDFSGIESSDECIIKEGKYKGKNAVYGYIIGNRNNMDIQFLSGGGRTMATPADGSFTNCFSNDIYKAIDNDIDYITLYFGINDSHHEAGSPGDDGEDKSGEIPLGTIDDSTINTYYGAWNVVLPYLIEHFPFAHIGIIVSNGCDRDAYRIATIEIANKWGIPYIDLNGDERTPMMLRSTNPNISSQAKNARLLSQRVSSTNYHPNPKAHEYESYFIENFLRSI